MPIRLVCFALLAAWLVLPSPAAAQPARIPVIVDTDANNELDDQHALAYVLLDDRFAVEGITVNATRGGGAVDRHVEEARRVMALCGVLGSVPLERGANGSFAEIRPTITRRDFDGKAAVDFIVARALAAHPGRPLVLLPIGKLTNVALALAHTPSIAPRIRIVWLGSNYPEPGEYNQENDPEALRFVLAQDVAFEMALVNYGRGTGTDAVRVTREDVATRVAGRGPRLAKAITGRHGEEVRTFGDYSVSLFAHITLDGTPPSRALYDLAAAAIVKHPGWARSREIAAPALVGERWEERPGNPRRIVIWEHFDRRGILDDFYATLERASIGPR